MPSVSVTDGSNKIFIIFPKLMLDTNESMLIFLSSFDRKIIPENRNKYKPFHITYKEVMTKLEGNIDLGDIVGGKDYLTGISMKKPIGRKIWTISSGKEKVVYKLEGET